MDKKPINADEVSRAFHLLSSYNGIVRWAARKGDAIEGSWAATPLELVQFAEAYADCDFYVQLNPSDRRHGRRCRAEDIAAWEWFVVDLDPEGDYRPDLYTLRTAGGEVTQAIQSYTGKPYVPVAVFSGRGLQLWFHVGAHEWRLVNAVTGAPREFDVHAVDLWAEDPVTVKRTITLRDAIASAQRYWLAQLATRVTDKRIIVDPSVSDLPRLMRCPGTYNRKTGSRASFIYVNGRDLGAGASVQANLGYKLLKYTPSDRMYSSIEPGITQLPEGAPWQAALSKINSTAAGTITYGATEPGRHRAMSGAARALAEVGLEEEEILKALTVAGMRSRPELLDGPYLERTARDAVARFSRTGDPDDAVFTAIKNNLDAQP